MICGEVRLSKMSEKEMREEICDIIRDVIPNYDFCDLQKVNDFYFKVKIYGKSERVQDEVEAHLKSILYFYVDLGPEENSESVDLDKPTIWHYWFRFFEDVEREVEAKNNA